MVGPIKTNYFWSVLGKIALIITILWGGTQIYNNFIKKDFNIIATGENSPFILPNYFTQVINDYSHIKSLDSAYLIVYGKNKVHLSTAELNALLSTKSANFEEQDFKTQYNYLRLLEFNQKNYLPTCKSMWLFNIENNGNKPVEDLALDLPFNGYYMLLIKNELPKYATFKNQVPIGILKSSYYAKIVVWSENELDAFLNSDEEKSKVIHKYGMQDVEFPVKVTGFIAWMHIFNEMPISMSFFSLWIIFFLGLFVYGLGERATRKKYAKQIKE